MLVGLTGGIGSGKTAAANYFAKLGIDVVDADVASRAVVETGKPALAKIREHFGQDILLSDSTLDRAKLRSIVLPIVASADGYNVCCIHLSTIICRHKLLPAPHPTVCWSIHYCWSPDKTSGVMKLWLSMYQKLYKSSEPWQEMTILAAKLNRSWLSK